MADTTTNRLTAHTQCRCTVVAPAQSFAQDVSRGLLPAALQIFQLGGSPADMQRDMLQQMQSSLLRKDEVRDLRAGWTQ